VGFLRRQKRPCYTGRMPPPLSLASTLSDAALVARVRTLAEHERHVTADLIASLAELDARRLYLGAGCSSLFTYCTEVLHLSEQAAYGRVGAARAARRFPLILARLAEGAITLTTVCLLAPVLTDDNHERLLETARHKSKREVELIVADVRPQPAVPSAIRRLPRPASGECVPRPGAAGADVRLPAIAGEGGDVSLTLEVPSPPVSPVAALPPPPPAIIRPLAPERYRVQFTMSREMHDTFRRVQELMRHQLPDGDPAIIFDRALTLLRDHLERQKCAAAATPHDERVRATPSCAGRGATSGVGARRGTLRVCRHEWPVPGTRLPGVPPRSAVCRRRRDHSWESSVAMSRPQCL
jgi:hypothetical protein